jgi:leucyl-tRNA synthetase
MLEKGIAYRKTQVVNWDPVDQTVLANEQVIDGKGWRTGAVVEKREIPGYYLKITDYAQELLDHVHGQPRPAERLARRVKLMQENWIGKSEGVRFAFPHDIRCRRRADRRRQDVRLHHPCRHHHGRDLLRRGARAPAGRARRGDQPGAGRLHRRVPHGGTTEAELATQEKKGMPTGLSVTHPLTGEPVAVWVGNYVLMSYGDGAVMGVPAHDERDFAFAKKYGIDILQVVQVDGENLRLRPAGRTGMPTSSAA